MEHSVRSAIDETFSVLRSMDSDIIKYDISHKQPKPKFESEETTMSTDFMKSMFGPLAAGMCRLSANGKIAVKTSGGYKTYNTKTGALTNCGGFVFDAMGDDMFFVIPTNKVKPGDIIIVNKPNGKAPCCVISVKGKNAIEVMNYETSVVETIVPERHIFLGNTFFYGKIVSPFTSMFANGKDKGVSSMMKYMLMSSMMKGMNGGATTGMNPFVLAMFGGGDNIFANMFDGMFSDDNDFGFDFAGDEDEDVDEDSNEEESEG